MRFKFLLTGFVFVVFSSIVYAADANILYISDNIHLTDSFDAKYVDLIQNFIDEDYGKGKIQIQKISRFDINTTECFEFLEIFNQKKLPKAVILMIGEANYHNLYGFSTYIQNIDKDKPKIIPVPKTLKQVSKEISEIYGADKESGNKIVDIAYKQIINGGRKDFNPKVIPDFQVLKKDFSIDNNILSSVEVYRHAWTLIREKKYEKAKEFLEAVLDKKPSLSMLYYALGSLYLIEQKENAEINALKIFEEGILVEPFNRNNLCYKGLILLFMMYKGEITAEVLYFSRALNLCVPNISDEISAITTINTPNYEKKIQVIDKWILYDIAKIVQICNSENIKLVFTTYPVDVEVNKVISDDLVKGSHNTFFFSNKVSPDENADFRIYKLAKSMYSFLKNNRII
ncbi:MAG: tetratricopeptide repeat protein [Endomicrobiaceae bacterium]